jgi:oxaloacetate decarboxylase gamma subunit
MTIVDMLGQSGILTVLGMGVVFLFIIIMIICMGLVHKIVHALKLDVKKEAAVSAASVKAATPGTGASGDNKAVVAAIAVALRNKR